MSQTKILPTKTTRLSERNKSKEDLAKRKAEEELVFHNPKKQMFRRNREDKEEFDRKLLKDKSNPFETHSRASKPSTTKAKEIPTKLLKVDREPIPKRKKIEMKPKKKIFDIDLDREIIDPHPKNKTRVFSQKISEEHSFDSSSEELFENIHFAKKEKKPQRFEFKNDISHQPLFQQQQRVEPSYLFSQPQKIIANEVPELIRSSNQTTIELLHAVQLIFHDRADDAVRVIEIPYPENNNNARAMNNNMMEFL